MDQTPETQEPTKETELVVPVRIRAKNFLNRHQPKLRAIALIGGGAVAFGAGRKSKDYVESVDVEVNSPDSPSDPS